VLWQVKLLLDRFDKDRNGQLDVNEFVGFYAEVKAMYEVVVFSRRLCFLSVYQRIVFKVAGLVHQSLAGVTPAYLADDCCLLSDAGRRPLRSDSNELRNLLVPRTHSKLGDRSFSVAGPRLWNDLPPRLLRPGLSFDTFRQSLKTYLFGDRSA